jgi:hypothetical protein
MVRATELRGSQLSVGSPTGSFFLCFPKSLSGRASRLHFYEWLKYNYA